jgi:polysaccharide biosynthesis protein PslH
VRGRWEGVTIAAELQDAAAPSGRRRRLLYLSPVTPKAGGNGLAMRAAMMLGALARHFDIDLFVFPVAGALEPVSEELSAQLARIGTVDPRDFLDTHFGFIERIGDAAARSAAALAYPKPFTARFSNAASAKALAAWTSGRHYDVIHALRLYLAPLLEPLRQAPLRPRIVFDLDDDDAAYYENLAALCRAGGDHAGMQAAAAEARKYRVLAEHSLADADLCLLASANDRDRFAQRFPDLAVRSVPNGYHPVETVPAPVPRPDELRLLFVGTLGYAPNADAAMLLVRDILPALRAQAPVPVRLDIIGADAPAALALLARDDPRVTVHGFVEDLAPHYAAADLVAMPLRIGSGTRIKLLESFAYRRPVVATRLAAAGLEVIDGEHLLLADDPRSFVRACLRLYREPGLAAGCVERAASLVQARYHPDRVAEAILDAYSTLGFGSDRPGASG